MNVPQAQSPMFEHVLALEGRTVLYIEKMSLFRVVVAEVRPSEDGQGFDCLATFVPTPGMVSSEQPGASVPAGTTSTQHLRR
jgi:hypothetical protein